MNDLYQEQLKEELPFQNAEVLKVTALFYLKEALAREAYEQCAELIRLAKQFGANIPEVKSVLKKGAPGPVLGRRKPAVFTKRF